MNLPREWAPQSPLRNVLIVFKPTVGFYNRVLRALHTLGHYPSLSTIWNVKVLNLIFYFIPQKTFTFFTYSNAEDLYLD